MSGNKEIVQLDLGNTRGMQRKLDSANRVVIPKEFTRFLNIKKDDLLELFLTNDGFYARKVK